MKKIIFITETILQVVNMVTIPYCVVLGGFRDIFFQLSSKYIGDVGGSKKALILDLAP